MTGLSRSVLPPILVLTLAYAGCAWLGTHYAVTEAGMAVVWPANAVLLTGFLVLSHRHWPLLVVATVIAETLVDLPLFPLWASVSFGLINNFEALLAAWLIRRVAGEVPSFDRIHTALAFLVSGPLVASCVAALLGAWVYIALGRDDSSYLSLWRLWWFGDALGLLVLTPMLVACWRALGHGLPRLGWARVAEFGLLWLLIWLLSGEIFGAVQFHRSAFHLTPVLLLPLALWASIRFGVPGASLTVAFIAAIATNSLVDGHNPYLKINVQFAIWLVQEYLAILAVVAVGLAILLGEIRRHSVELEQGVQQRTRSLREANSALSSANEQLRELVATDYLTGIANRRHFYQVAQRILQRLQEEAGTASLIMLDLDHFKAVNDTHGHEVGDLVLRRVVSPVYAGIRPMDLFGRIGGEEFLVLLPGATLEEALQVAERIREAIAQLEVGHDGGVVKVTASFGVVQWQPGTSLDQLISRVDKALYQAKAAGRNRVVAG